MKIREDLEQIDETLLDNPLYQGWADEEDAKENVPDFDKYKWYQSTTEPSYIYSLGEAIEEAITEGDTEKVEEILEEEPEAEEALETIENVDVEPLIEEVKENNEIVDKVVEDIVEKAYTEEEEKIIQNALTWENDNSGNKYLPYKLWVIDDEVKVSKIGTGPKQPLEEFQKNYPKDYVGLINLIK